MFVPKATQMTTQTPQHHVPCALLTPSLRVMHQCRTPVVFVKMITMTPLRAPTCNAMRAPPIPRASRSARRLATAIASLAPSMSTKNARLSTEKRLFLPPILIFCLNAKYARFVLEVRTALGHVVAPSTLAASTAQQTLQQPLMDPKV